MDDEIAVAEENTLQTVAIGLLVYLLTILLLIVAIRRARCAG